MELQRNAIGVCFLLSLMRGFPVSSLLQRIHQLPVLSRNDFKRCPTRPVQHAHALLLRHAAENFSSPEFHAWMAMPPELERYANIRSEKTRRESRNVRWAWVLCNKQYGAI